jgi:hypothetical protein
MVVAAATLPADFSYQQTSSVTGGMMASMMSVAGVFSKQAREPVVTTVAVKGDRMVHRSATSATVIDLGSQTITTIDLQRKTYSVMTFDEMKQMLAQLSQRQTQNSNADMHFKVSVNDTGNTKLVAGFQAKEMVVKMETEATDSQSGQKGSMVITMDTWIAPSVPGYDEVRDFYRRMGEKIDWNPGGGMFMNDAGVAKGMAEVSKEVARLDGMPVLHTVTMGGAGTVPAGQAGQQTAPQAQPQQQQPQQRPSIGGALGGALGGRFGLGRKKSQSDQDQQAPAAQPASSGNASAPGTLLEMTTELSSFSSGAVDDSQFTIPAGFKKVEPAAKRGTR